MDPQKTPPSQFLSDFAGRTPRTFFSPITVTRSYRIRTCFPFTPAPRTASAAQCRAPDILIQFSSSITKHRATCKAFAAKNEISALSRRLADVGAPNPRRYFPCIFLPVEKQNTQKFLLFFRADPCYTKSSPPYPERRRALSRSGEVSCKRYKR